MKRKDKPITIIAHARKRMRERGISDQQVERTIREADRAAPQTNRGQPRRVRFEKSLSKSRRLKVIADEEPGRIIVVTAFF